MKCGLFVDPELPFLAASPDGLLEDSIIEIKCPYSAKNISITEAISLKKISFWKTDKCGTLIINKRHDWFYQVQGQLHITRRNVCIFVVWTEVDMKVEQIEKDDAFWEKNMKDKLKKFYFDCMLPEIIDSRLDRKMNIREPEYILEAIQRKEAATHKRKSSNTNKSVAKRERITN